MNEPGGDHLTEMLSDDLELNDIDDAETTDDGEGDEERDIRSPREGLPSTFRMRHDAHYVDELMSRGSFVPAALERDLMARSAPPPASAARPHAPAAPAGRAAPSAAAANLALVATRLESVVGHADGVRAEQGASSLVAHSVRVEFARVARLARAAVTLEHREAPLRRPVSAGLLAERVRKASAPVARSAGLEFSLTVGDATFAVPAALGATVQAIAGTVDAIVDLLLADPRFAAMEDEDGSKARLSIAIHSVAIRPALIIDLNCPALLVTEAQAGRFFDHAADEYRATPTAGALLAAAAQIVRAHGGRAEIKPQDAGGATITFVLPQIVTDASGSR